MTTQKKQQAAQEQIRIEGLGWGYSAIAWVIGAGTLILLLAGLLSKLSLGDEIHHYRFAKDCFYVNDRALFDAAYGSPAPPGFYYDTEFLWPFLLSKIWLLFGTVSFPAAQIYQSLFYAGLIFFTYCLGRRLYTSQVGFFGGLIVAGMPMMVSFGILFYMDLPMTAVVTAALVCLLYGRCTAAGILIAAGYLIKRSAVFYAPAISLYLVYVHRKNLKRTIAALLKVWVPAALIYWAETVWRSANLYKVGGGVSSMLNWLAGRMKSPLSQLVRLTDYQNSSVLNPVDLVKYSGVVFAAGLLLYLAMRKFQKKDWFLVVFAFSFAVITVLLRLFPDIRYLMPAFPLLAVLSAKGISCWAGEIQWRRKFVIVIVFLQLISAAAFTCAQRSIPSGVLEGFRFIKENIPQQSYVLYPETNLTEYTGRPLLWSRMNLRALFWGAESDKVEQLSVLRLKYIVIKKTRVYDDRAAEALHLGKYPKSFVDWLGNWPYAKRIFDNQDISVYQIDLLAKEEGTV